jgi:hypothetical protein
VFRGVIGALSRDMCSKVRCVQGCGGMDWALSRECVQGGDMGSKVRYVCKGVGNNVFRGVICVQECDRCPKS